MFESSPPVVPNQVFCHVALVNFPLAFQGLGRLQREDSVLADIIAKLERVGKVGNYSLSKCTLYCRSGKGRGQELVVPTAAIPMVFAYFQDLPLGGYLGISKTIKKIRSQFIWKGMDKEVRSRVRACHICALSKPEQLSRFGLSASEVAQRPMQKIFIDYVGKLPCSKAGNTAILICVDAFSKFGRFPFDRPRLKRPQRLLRK
jgi:hypothetical protein